MVERTSAQLVPPNPNEVFIAWRTARLLAVFAT
jgi:hypothetical protein